MHNSVALQVHDLYCKTCVMLTIIKEFLVDKIYPHRMMYTDDLVSLWLRCIGDSRRLRTTHLQLFCVQILVWT